MEIYYNWYNYFQRRILCNLYLYQIIIVHSYHQGVTLRLFLMMLNVK